MRNHILFFSGLLGVAHQTLWAAQVEPSLLLLFASMMGVPAFLNKDEQQRSIRPPRDGRRGGRKGTKSASTKPTVVPPVEEDE